MCEETKVCSACKKGLPLSAFRKDNARRDGLSVYCVECVAARRRARDARIRLAGGSLKRTRTPEQEAKVAEQKRAWKKANAEKLKAKHKAYYEANKEKCKAKSDAWRLANPERVLEIGRNTYRKRRKENPEYDRERDKVWRSKPGNQEKCTARSAEWRTENPEKYAARLIGDRMGLRIADIPPALARLKAEQLEIKRLSKQIKTQLKEESK